MRKVGEVSPHPYPSHGGEDEESGGSFSPPLGSPPTEVNMRKVGEVSPHPFDPLPRRGI
ncbi:MAG: hypothetical protein LBP62_05165 [Clostridiales bacterium]|nr:hypothetical protein [Clostridiales bacterium]